MASASATGGAAPPFVPSATGTMTSSSPSPTGVDAGYVATRVADGVAHVTFYHPKGNSLPRALLARLADEIGSLAVRPDVTVIVLGSDGSGPFCAGASFDEFRAVSDADGGHAFFMGFARLILAMIRCPKLIVARVHGKVAGGGVGMVAAADYALAVDGASVRLSELAVGIGPFVVGPVIERKIGLAAFGAMSIDADWRDAAWAREVGLFAGVVPDATALDTAVATLAGRLARANPDATIALKRVLWEGTAHWEDLLPERARISGRLVLSRHTQEAIAAFARRG